MSSKLRVIAPLATFLVVVGVVLAIALLGGGRSGSARPARLHLASSGFATAAGAGAPGTTNPGYELDGPLPEGTPPDAPVWSLGAGADASALRQVLGDKGLRTYHASWSWSTCAAQQPEPPPAADGSTSGGVACASAGTVTAAGPGTTPAPRPTLDPDRAREVARRVFEAVGLDVGAATVETSEYGGSVTLTPPVAGLDTSGYSTSVQLDENAAITSASGYLGSPTRGDSYPLITARQAYERIPIAPRADVCRITPDGHGCIEPPTPVITGARLGLVLQSTTEGDQLLVPAWLFTVRGSDQPLAQVAVDPAFLGGSTPAPEPSGTSEPGSGKTAPGSGPLPAQSAPPAPPAKG